MTTKRIAAARICIPQPIADHSSIYDDSKTVTTASKTEKHIAMAAL